MRLSELGDKEIVNLYNGSRHGQLADAELLFDPKQGKIKGLMVPETSERLSFMGSRDYIQLPWSSIRKIGEDIIIFEAEL
ncbi:YlmC/YmxH family sporulation protein [Anaerovorax sp. IOR16]|uniref:YlmC/YmxH family sporulation protein n=1 Tax=Anaerovorax sp. IOR16 TaxID=2773458 RepID=UPI0019CF4CF4|nr:YlmC/YmxH family sporulation protein [Anaerovorax sp. IOR16]